MVTTINGITFLSSEERFLPIDYLGNDGDEHLIVSGFVEWIDTFGGNDTISATIDAFSEADIDGSRGDDFIDITLYNTPDNTLEFYWQSLYVSGGDGNDILRFTDTFAPGAGARNISTLQGRSGDDVLLVNNANAELSGGTGNDVFVAGNNARDEVNIIITDFTVSGPDADTIDLQAHYGIINLDNVNLDENDAGDAVISFTQEALTSISQFVEQVEESMEIATFQTAHPHVFETEFANGAPNTVTITLEGVGSDELTDEHLFVLPEFILKELTEETVFLSDLSRASYVDLGETHIADWNGDGLDDVISVNGHYGNGLVWINAFDESINRVTHIDPGNYELLEVVGRGNLDIVTDAFGGLGYINGFTGSFTRLSHNQVDDYQVLDTDIFTRPSLVTDSAAFGNGTPISGTVSFDLSSTGATLQRVSFHSLGEQYAVGNFDGDRDAEIISNGGTYASGAEINGFVVFDQDGSLSRFNFQGSDDFIVADVNADGIDELIVNGLNGNAGGFVLYADGTHERLTFNDLGEFAFGDLNGDGVGEVVSANGAYGSGAAIGGLVAYDVDSGAMSRLSYQNIGSFELGDNDGDGDLEVFASGGNFGNGVVIMDGIDLIA